MNSKQARLGHAAIYGALGGIAGAGCMTALRSYAQRLRLIDLSVPQATSGWVVEKTGMEPPGGLAGRQLTSDVIHLVVAAAWGAAYGLASTRPTAGEQGGGAVFGAAEWLLDAAVLTPLLRVTAPPWRATLAANAVNLVAHVVHGAVTATVTRQLLQRHATNLELLPASVREGVPTG